MAMMFPEELLQNVSLGAPVFSTIMYTSNIFQVKFWSSRDPFTPQKGLKDIVLIQK